MTSVIYRYDYGRYHEIYGVCNYFHYCSRYDCSNRKDEIADLLKKEKKRRNE